MAADEAKLQGRDRIRSFFPSRCFTNLVLVLHSVVLQTEDRSRCVDLGGTHWCIADTKADVQKRQAFYNMPGWLKLAEQVQVE